MIVGSDFIRYTFSSGGVIVIALALAIWIALTASRRSRRVLLFVMLGAAVVSIYAGQFVVAQLLVGSLKPFEAADVQPARRTVVAASSPRPSTRAASPARSATPREWPMV